MLVNSITNFKYDMSNRMANHKQDAPAPQPVKDEGTTASIYFGSKEGKTMRNATLAGLGSLMLLTTLPSCEKDETWSKSESSSSAIAKTSDTTIVKVCTHAKGCCCHDCQKGRDTIYQVIPGPTEYVHDTIHHHDTINHYDTIHHYDSIPVEIPIYVYVDTGSYHVTHDTITKWKHDWQKPIPLDTLDKIIKDWDIDGVDPSRRNIISYQGVREWEYGNRCATMMNQLESSRNILVYDREDFDWEGNHTGWGKDIYRVPEGNFTIQTYGGKTINNPKGLFVETYVNEADKKESFYSPDRKLVTRQFFQSRGDSVYVFTFDKETGLYREDGRVSKGYLDKNTILLTDLIASDPDKKFARDPEYSTEDHIVNCKVITVNDEELEALYLRAKDDEIAEQKYGVADNARTRTSFAPWNK